MSPPNPKRSSYTAPRMQPWEHTRAARLSGPLGLIALTIAGVILLSITGLPDHTPRVFGPSSVILLLVNAGGVALAYIFGAFGLGRPLVALLAPSSQSRTWLQLGLGIATMLWLSHALGLAGALSGRGITPRIIGWVPIVLGLLLFLDQLVRGRLRPEKWPVLPVASILWAPGLALLLVAASNPVGTLWGLPTGTEYNGFDALEYHLQLPKEWAAGARLWPSDHNVYSYLPSFMEAAFLHLGTLMLGGEKCNDPAVRMLAGASNDGNWVIACQYLHAGIAIVGAMLTARAASVLLRRVRAALPAAAGQAAVQPPHEDADDPIAAAVGIIAGALVLCTPWMVVVSSLPYNDAAVTTLAAAGVLVALDDRIRNSLRALLAGWAAGVACGCKPTALFMAGPVVGLLLLGNMHWRRWPLAILTGSIAGLIATGPWLWRNWAASHNPVFPFAARLFGTGHWTAEQVERHTRNHHAPPDLPVSARIGRLFSGEFGFLHTQWGMLLPVLIGAAMIALAWRPARRFAALLLGAIIAQCVCWIALTHLQSRFLLPIITPAALLVALAGAALITWVTRSGQSRTRALRVFALLVLALIPLDHIRRSISIFLQQNDETPNLLLVRGVGWLTGFAKEETLAGRDDRARAEAIALLQPFEYINLVIRPQAREDAAVYLLGDSTPLYLLAATGAPPRPAANPSPIVYNTTWDTPLLVRAKKAAGEDPAAWSVALRRRGIRYVLINYDELHRLIDRNRYYDPNLSMVDVVRWVAASDSHLKSIRAWRSLPAPGTPSDPYSGVELFEIDLPGPAAPTTGTPTLQERPR
jgi:hypothetical protein